MRLYKVRTELVVGTEISVLGRHILFAHLAQRLAVVCARGFPIPPRCFAGPAIERAGAGDRDIVLVMSVDQRREIHDLVGLEPSEHRRQIISGRRAESNGRAFGEMQIDAGF